MSRLLSARDLAVIQAALEHCLKHAKTDELRWATEDAMDSCKRVLRTRERWNKATTKFRAKQRTAAS